MAYRPCMYPIQKVRGLDESEIWFPDLSKCLPFDGEIELIDQLVNMTASRIVILCRVAWLYPCAMIRVRNFIFAPDSSLNGTK